jgi:hypothetical protein
MTREGQFETAAQGRAVHRGDNGFFTPLDQAIGIVITRLAHLTAKFSEISACYECLAGAGQYNGVDIEIFDCRLKAFHQPDSNLLGERVHGRTVDDDTRNTTFDGKGNDLAHYVSCYPMDW